MWHTLPARGRHPVRRYWFESRKLSDPADLSWFANQPLLVEVRRRRCEDFEDRGLSPGEVGHFLAIYTELRLNGAHNISIAGLKMPIHLYGQRANHLFGSDADAMPDFITGYDSFAFSVGAEFISPVSLPTINLANS